MFATIPTSITSVNDIVQMTPFTIRDDITVNQTGTYNYTILTIPSCCRYYICTTLFYNYAGAASYAAINIFDKNGTGAAIHAKSAPPIGIWQTCSPHTYCDTGCNLNMYWGITAQPFSYRVEVSGLVLTV